MNTNQSTVTPIGKGIVQGMFAITDAAGQPITKGVMVRLAVDDVTRPHLNKSNCLTPRTKKSGLWVFKESELK